MARRWAWGLAGWAFVLLACGIPLHVLNHGRVGTNGQGPLGPIGAVVLSLLGAFVASRQPRNPIGWAFLAAGVSFAYGGFAVEYVGRAVLVAPGSLPFATAVAWTADCLTFLPVWVPILLIPYAFPTGRLVSRRWRIGLAVGLLAVAGITVGSAFGPYLAQDLVGRRLPNPLALPSFERALGAVGNVLWLFPFVSLAIGAVSLIVRFRRSHGIERQQLKWIAFSGIFVVVGCLGVVFNVALKFSFFEHTQILAALIVIGMGSMPITVSIAILRYRLYDVDRLIRRTVSYLIVTALLASLYALVVLTPAVAFGTTHVPNALVAVGTLLAAMAFVPVRRRVQAAVDRRFNRSRFDATRTIERFGSRLALEVDLDVMASELAGIVRETMQPSLLGLWLRAL